MSEVQTIRDSLSEITNAKFEVAKPVDNYPPTGRVNWILRILDGAYVRNTPHVTLAWSDKEGTIWLESFELGSTLDWVEQQYGEKGLEKLADVNLDQFEKTETRENFGKQFPRVLRRLEVCEKIVSKISSKRGIHLKLVYEQTNHLVYFRLGARVNGKGVDMESKLEMIKSAVEALRESYDEICEYEAEKL